MNYNEQVEVRGSVYDSDRSVVAIFMCSDYGADSDEIPDVEHALAFLHRYLECCNRAFNMDVRVDGSLITNKNQGEA